jgi:hypothetical protein
MTGLGRDDWLLGAAVLLVLWLLYLLKPRRRRVEVPFGGLWRQVLTEADAASWGSRWRKWLSFLVMAMIAGTLLAALAQPVRPRLKTEPGPQAHVVLLLDRSASMATRDAPGPLAADGLPPSRLTAAVAKARELVSKAPPSVAFLAVAASGHAEVLAGWGADRTALLARLDALQPVDAALDLAQAHAAAAEALIDRANSHIVWLTDGGTPAELAGSVSPALEELRVLPTAVTTAVANVAVDNVAVEDVRVRPDPTDAERGTVTVRLRNDRQTEVAVQLHVSSSAQAQTVAEFADEANLRALHEATLAPGRTTVQVADVALPSPRLCVRVQPRTPGFRDRLAADDVGLAVLAAHRELHVLLVGGDDNLFLQAALQASDRVKLTTLAAANYRPDDFRALDRVRHHVDLVVLDQVDAALPEGTPGLLLRGALKPDERALRGPELVVRAGDHPLMAGVSFQDLNVDQARVLPAVAGMTVLAGVSIDGRVAPVMAAHVAPVRRLEWGLDLLETDLGARYALPILVQNAVAWLAGEDQPLVPPLELGRQWSVTVPAAGAWQWLEPGRPARPARQVGDRVLASSERAGVQVWRGPQGVEVVRPTQLPAEEAPGVRQPAGLRFDGLPQPPADALTVDRPLWLWLVVAVALALLVEWATYLRRRTL